MVVGILALQGAYREHVKMLNACGVKGLEIRLPEQLGKVAGLIIPGGESTTIAKLMLEYGFPGSIKGFAASGRPIFGTCAGLIVLANKLAGEKQELLNLIDIDVRRNAYGRQIESREVSVEVPFLDGKPFNAVFIRAPVVEKAGQQVKILATYKERPVIARQENILVSSFHPELTGDTGIHRYFLEMIEKR
jgi:5'-phosphate synthase pdxT subunit